MVPTASESSPDPAKLLADAQEAPAKVQLEEYRSVVETLREKGYSWREVAEFLSQRGVVTDHTRVYRHFGERKKKQRHTERKVIEISRMSFVGLKPTKKNKARAWNVLEMDLPSKLGQPITVRGFAWGGPVGLDVGDDGALSFRNAHLVVRAGNRGFPMAYVTAELKVRGGEWLEQEIYIVPKWDALL